MFFKIFILFFIFFNLPVYAISSSVDFSEELICAYPSCSSEGEISCPEGFSPICIGEYANVSEPKCIFVETAFIPGCYKFERDEEIDLSFFLNKMPPSTMITSMGGKVFTLRVEDIRCRKI